MPEVTQLFPNLDPIDRSSINAWLDANFRKAIQATGRKKLVVAGLPHYRPRCPIGRRCAPFGGYRQRLAGAAPAIKFAAACECGSACNVHGHAHAASWGADVPTADAASFWSIMGCSCWAT